MSFRFIHTLRLASRASVLAILASPTGVPSALAAETEILAGQQVTVLSRSVVAVPDGTVTYLRIRPPVFPTPPPSPPPSQETPLPPELQAALKRAEAKPYAMLALTATVYTRADDSAVVTELTWRDGERAFRAWSTCDFRLLRQLSTIETETHRFHYFPFVDAQPLAECPTDRQPAGIALFPSTTAPDALPEYCFEGTEADAAATEPVLAALDWLHAHAHLNRASLIQQIAELARREAEAAEQARQAAEAPAQPRDEKVFFWKIR